MSAVSTYYPPSAAAVASLEVPAHEPVSLLDQKLIEIRDQIDQIEGNLYQGAQRGVSLVANYQEVSGLLNALDMICNDLRGYLLPKEERYELQAQLYDPSVKSFIDAPLANEFQWRVIDDHLKRIETLRGFQSTPRILFEESAKVVQVYYSRIREAGSAIATDADNGGAASYFRVTGYERAVSDIASNLELVTTELESRHISLGEDVYKPVLIDTARRVLKLVGPILGSVRMALPHLDSALQTTNDADDPMQKAYKNLGASIEEIRKFARRAEDALHVLEAPRLLPAGFTPDRSAAYRGSYPAASAASRLGDEASLAPSGLAAGSDDDLPLRSLNPSRRAYSSQIPEMLGLPAYETAGHSAARQEPDTESDCALAAAVQDGYRMTDEDETSALEALSLRAAHPRGASADDPEIQAAVNASLAVPAAPPIPTHELVLHVESPPAGGHFEVRGNGPDMNGWNERSEHIAVDGDGNAFLQLPQEEEGRPYEYKLVHVSPEGVLRWEAHEGNRSSAGIAALDGVLNVRF